MTTLRSLGKHEEGNLLFILVLTEVTFWIFHSCHLLSSVCVHTQPPLQSFPLDCFLLPGFLSCLSVLHIFISLTLDPTCGIFVSDCLESSGLKCTPLSCTTSIQRNASLSPHAVELFSFVPLSRPSPRSSSIEVFLRPIFYLVSLLY